MTLIIAIALALVLLSIAQDDPRSQPVPELKPSAYDRKLTGWTGEVLRLRTLLSVGLLFQNWMTDTNQASQDRALRGHRNAREIYIKVMTGLDDRDPEGAEK